MVGLCNSGFVEEQRNVNGGLMGNLKERDRLEDLEVDGIALLMWILKKSERNMRAGFIGLRTLTSSRLL